MKTVHRNEAEKIIHEHIKTPAVELIPTRESLGRVLAEDVFTPAAYPDTPKSAVDGYAFKHGRVEYLMMGDVAAGENSIKELGENEAAFIMTGGTIPKGADTVARIEDCEEGDKFVNIPAESSKGENINNVGEEAEAGTLFIKSGTRIVNNVYPALFYLGKSEIKVFKSPKVGFFTTGDEIREVEEGYKEGKVFNTNRYILESFLTAVGADWEYYGAVKDSFEDVDRAMNEMTEKYDIIISSGGVSMGKYDFVKKVFLEKEFDVHFSRTKLRPGSPLFFANRDEKLFFGMPGYPAAFTTNAVFYLMPALKKALGRTDWANIPKNVEFKTATRAKEGRFEINRVTVVNENGRLFAYDPGTQKTSHYASFAQVNALVMLDEETGSLNIGDRGKVLLLNDVLS